MDFTQMGLNRHDSTAVRNISGAGKDSSIMVRNAPSIMRREAGRGTND
jgi:hypothetical protein